MRRVGLHSGVYAASIGLLITGGLAVLSATPAQFGIFWLGVGAIVLGILLLIWGLKIDGEHWWKSRKPNPQSRFTPAPHAAPANAADRDVFNETIGEIATDRIPYARLREIAHEYGVAFPRFGAEQNNAYYFEGALRQAAVDGDLAVWGRKYRGEVKSNDPLVRIPASHFEDFEFAHGNLDFDAPNIKARTGTIHMTRLGIEGEVDVTFYDLHLANKAACDVLRAFGEGLKNGNA